MASLLAVVTLTIVVLTLWPQEGERIDPTTRPVAHSVQLMLDRAQAWESGDFETEIPFTFVRLEKKGCYGPCPVYSVSFHRDGRAELFASEFLDLKGGYRATIEQYEYARLAQMIDYARESIEGGYYRYGPDVEVFELTIGLPSGERRVTGSTYSVPPDLWATVQVIDAMRVSATWSAH
jgi:hypothetical protein